MKRIMILASVIVGLTQCKQSNMNTESTEQVPTAFDLSNLDSSISPCDNFYRYAIGGWLSANPVPPTESRWMSFNILEEENRKKINQILLETNKLENVKKGSDEQLVRDLYRSAMDSVQIEKTGISPLKPILDKINGIQNSTDLATTVAAMQQVGIGSFMSLYVGRDAKNSEQYQLSYSQTGLSLPDKEYYLSNDAKYVEFRNQYKQHINNVFQLAKFSDSDPALAILNIETKLAKLHWDRNELRSPEKTYNKRAFNDFANSFTNFDFKAYMKSLAIKQVDSLNVGQPSFYVGLDKLLKEIPMSDWKLYLKMKTISAYGSWSGSKFETEQFNFFSKQLKGVKTMRPRSERVNRLLNDRLGETLGKLFVAKHFPASSKAYMERMIENMRDAYGERIQTLTWMGDSTKQKAMKKLKSFTYKIGYPDVWKDYSTLEITDKDVLQNLMNISGFQFKMMVDKLGKPIDKTEWFMSPQTVNAYYSSAGNEIVFPAGILQPPFFHLKFDDAVNYGGIGAVIGHEFTHGFDDKGSKSDWNGNLNNWWTDEDRSRFDALTKALADQYSAYEPLPGMHLNGEMTLGENIADLGGLTLAYAALSKELKGKKDPVVDGFTWQQRFYLSWANVWKGNITDDELRNRILTDYHSPSEFRVLGPLANLPEFRDAFGCANKKMSKSDSTMIKIW